ncbi:MAG: nodulation protein NfeD [Gammaproteobacteria bacterium]|jgi:membrane-bound serine protease (ClpP class)
MTLITRILSAIILLTSCPLFLSSNVYANPVDNPIIQLSIDGAIGPATSDYIERAFARARQQNASLIIIRIDTPGGLDSAMRKIIREITNSSIPVASYVSPTGARAASAGTYILLASHIAAMTPSTNLGAATPVKIGGGLPSPSDPDKKAGQDNDSAMKNKIINDAVAYIRGLAALHGRNQDWAEKAVREGDSLTANDALKLNVIDIIATDMGDLLKQIHGREIKVLGKKRTLETTGLPIQQLEPDWRSRFLNVITNPNIAYILMLIGIYGLILEFSNPGAIIPGTVGSICLLLALYSFQLLPINYAGMALILLGVALMVGEAYEPSFGILGIGGVIAFIIGSIILMDTKAPGFGIDISVIVTFSLTSALVFIFVVGMAIKARRRPVVSGLEELIGSEAVVINDFNQTGTVSIHSETWRAQTDLPVQKGQKVKVMGSKGLTLQVEPIPHSSGKTTQSTSSDKENES